ncbi:MAG: aminotransferase class IV [Chloroflexota bacterium]
MSESAVRCFLVAVEGPREIPAEAANLDTHSLTLPRGAYTTFRTYHRIMAPRLTEHLDRLTASAALDGYDLFLDHRAARAAIDEAVRRAGFAESRVRLTLTYESAGLLYVAVAPFTPLPERLYTEGAHCVTAPPGLRRENPRAKGTSFIGPGSQARAGLTTAHELLLLSPEGAILEGSSSNFFAILSGVLHTAEEGVLVGTTRNLVLGRAEGLLPIERRPVSVSELSAVQEAFLTSVSRGVLPVTKINQVQIDRGRPGPITQELARRLRVAVEATLEPLEDLAE